MSQERRIHLGFGERISGASIIFLMKLGTLAEGFNREALAERCIGAAFRLYRPNSLAPLPLFLLYSSKYLDPSRPYRDPTFEPKELSITIDTITSFDETRLKQATAVKVPGFYRAVSAIHDDPEKFWKEELTEPPDWRTIKNPSFTQFVEGLEEMALHFLGKKDNMYRYTALRAMRHLIYRRELPPQVYSVLPAVVRSSYHPVRRLGFDLADIAIARHSDPLALDFVSANVAYLQRDDEKAIGIVPTMLQGVARLSNTSEQWSASIAKMLNMPEQKARAVVDFLQYLTSQGVEVFDLRSDTQSLLEAAEEKTIGALVAKLAQFGYRHFTSKHLPYLFEMAKNESELVAQLSKIREIYPDFTYGYEYFSFDADKVHWKDRRQGFLYKPYEVLVASQGVGKIFPALYAYIQKTGDIPQDFCNDLYKALRTTKRVSEVTLEVVEDKDIELVEEITRFARKIPRLLFEFYDSQGTLVPFRDIFIRGDVMQYFASHPQYLDELIELQNNHPQFLQLISPGGPLHANADSVVTKIIESSDPTRAIQQIEVLFTTKMPLWKQLYLFTETRLNPLLQTDHSQYPLTYIAGVSVVNLIERHQRAKQSGLSLPTRLEQILEGDGTKLQNVIKSKVIPFGDLKGEYKRLVFRAYLKDTIETSNDPQAKSYSDMRNRQLASTKVTVSDATYIHGSSIDYFGQVLHRGNLCGEALGEAARRDSYPFYVDFGVLEKTEQDVSKGMSKNMAAGYGKYGRYGSGGQLFYLYDRTKGSFNKDVRFFATEYHALTLAGMPSTEITQVVLREPSVTLDKVTRETLEYGVYIPIYDMNGNLLLTPQSYDQKRVDGNYRVPTETWDYSLKTGGQRGSNPGGEFTVATQGTRKTYYVKFSNEESVDHLWNEHLADNIYRCLEIPVPDTKIVRIEENYGHASEILPDDETSQFSDLKDGFLVDVLLSNWDIVANKTNVISVGGRTYRIDNGGALLFRAQGGRKTDFSGVVTELESMRYQYSGLTEEDIQIQVTTLREKLTDKAIDSLIDTVRLSSKDRDYLKRILKTRRDYLIAIFPTS